MTRRITVGLIGMALVLAACGTPQNESTTTSSAPAETTTTEPAPSTTTTTAATTTTAPEAEGDGSLMASLDAQSTVTSARVEGTIEMTGLDDSTIGVSEGVVLFFSAFDTETGDSEFLMDMSSFMDSVEIEGDDLFPDTPGMFSEIAFRQIGDTAYIKFPFFTAMLGSETEWVSMPADDGDAFASDFEILPTDPTELVENFDEEGASIEEIGTETVNGVEATHYRITLDPEAMDLSAEEEAELADSGVLTTGTIPMDIWISEEGYMARMIMVIDATELDPASGEDFETMTMTYDVFDVNAGVVIEEPPADQVTSMEDLEGGFDFDQ